MTAAVKLLLTLGRPLTAIGRDRPRASVAVAPASMYERYMGILIVGLPPRVRVGGKFRAFDAARAPESSYSRAATTTTGAFGGGENTVLC